MQQNPSLFQGLEVRGLLDKLSQHVGVGQSVDTLKEVLKDLAPNARFHHHGEE